MLTLPGWAAPQAGSHHDDHACLPASSTLLQSAHASGASQPGGASESFSSEKVLLDLVLNLQNMNDRCKAESCCGMFVDFLPLASGLPGGLGHATHSSNKSDIKREDKEDDDNSSVADKSEDEKKESKQSRTRARYRVF